MSNILLQRMPQQDPQPPQDDPNQKNPKLPEDPNDKPRPQTDPDKNPIAKLLGE